MTGGRRKGADSLYFLDGVVLRIKWNYVCTLVRGLQTNRTSRIYRSTQKRKVVIEIDSHNYGS